MHQGQILSLPSDLDVALWSPWAAKGGDRAVFTYELVAEIGASIDFDVEVWTKAREDRTTQGTRIAESTDFANVGGTSFYTASDIDGFEDLYRVRIYFSAGEGGATVIYRFLEPTWYVLAGSQS